MCDGSDGEGKRVGGNLRGRFWGGTERKNCKKQLGGWRAEGKIVGSEEALGD